MLAVSLIGCFSVSSIFTYKFSWIVSFHLNDSLTVQSLCGRLSFTAMPHVTLHFLFFIPDPSFVLVFFTISFIHCCSLTNLWNLCKAAGCIMRLPTFILFRGIGVKSINLYQNSTLQFWKAHIQLLLCVGFCCSFT